MAKKNLLKIENVYFAYTKIAKPEKNHFDTSGLLKEFSTTVILSKAQAKEFKAQKLNKTVKEIDTPLFEAKYKFAPPYPEQEEQFFISITKKATYKDGNLKQEWTFPKAYFVKDDTVIEGTSTLIGNGSSGDIRLELDFNEKLNTTNVVLDSVLIKEHVPFEAKGDEWATAAGIPSFVEAKPSVKAPQVAQSTRSETAYETDLEDDLPF